METIISSHVFERSKMGNDLKIRVNPESNKKKNNLLVVSNPNTKLFPSDFFENNDKINIKSVKDNKYYQKKIEPLRTSAEITNKILLDDEKDLEEDREFLSLFSESKEIKNFKPGPLSPIKNLYDLKLTGLNQIPEEDEDKVKTIYASNLKFQETKIPTNIKNLNIVNSNVKILNNKEDKLKLKERSVESPSTTNDSDKTKKSNDYDRINKLEVSDRNKCNSIKKSNKNKNIYFDFSSEIANTEIISPTHSELNSHRTRLSSQTPKLPLISTRASLNFEKDIKLFKEDPIIKKKLYEIFQNIEDIKKVLKQKEKTRMKITSAPVCPEENLDIILSEFDKKKVPIKLKNLNYKFPIKIVKN